MTSTLAPSAPQNALQLLDRGRVRAFGRRQDAPAIDEQFGKAGVGAGVLGAGDRMRRDQMHALRDVRRHVFQDLAFDRADVRHDRAGLERARNLCRDRPAGADRNADDDEVGVLRGLGVGLDHLIRDAELDHAAARRSRRAVATISRTTPYSRAARAIEPPIRPTPISARRSMMGLTPSSPSARRASRRRACSPLRCRWSCAARSADDTPSRRAAPRRAR